MRDAVHAIVTRALTSHEPMPPWDTVNRTRLDAALGAPRQSAFGQDAYPELGDKAGILMYEMVKQHPWANGNKRMALVSTLVFAALNGQWWEVEQPEAYAHVTWVAASNARCYSEAIAYLRKYFKIRLTPLEKAVQRASDESN